MPRHYWFYTAVNGLVVVMLGAFGAHGLEGHLSVGALQTWHTAVQYQMFHAVGLVAVASLLQAGNREPVLLWSGRLFVAGLLIFCGSLYLLALTGIKLLGAITPIGGVAWLVAWGLLGKAALAQPAQ